MKRHIVAGVYGSNDKISIATTSDEQLTLLKLTDRSNELAHGIGAAVSDLQKLGVFPSEIGIDLLVLAAHVQAADTHISRSSESQNSWTREITLVVPVSDVQKWNTTIVDLKRALNFLTGDIWKVKFRQRPSDYQYPKKEKPLIPQFPYDSLSLFSGGLDSLIGAIDLLNSGKNPLFISHAGEGAVSDAQRKCFDELQQHYKKNKSDRLRVWMSFAGFRISPSMEKTTRGRSFLFFSLGVLAGTGFETPFVLRVPENGLIALNVPLDSLRVGSHSTRTTHPFYIARWNDIIHSLGIEGRIENPYFNKTKGEMVEDCANLGLLTSLIPVSLSCSSPSKERWRGKGVQHCGYCLPCIIRRASIKKGLSSTPDPTVYTIQDLTKRALDSSKAEGKQIRSFQYALEKLRKDPRLPSLVVHTSGSLADESHERQQQLSNVYMRGMIEVAELLGGVVTKPK